MFSLTSFVFFIVLVTSIFIFYKNLKKIITNINLGRNGLIFSNRQERWKRVLFIAFGQCI